MRYQVPQFIEVEDKIFGPFTFRQFSYLIGGAGICFIIYKVTHSFFVGLPFMMVAAAVSCGLAFYKINNRPLIETIEAAFKFGLTKRLYIWQKKDKLPNSSAVERAMAQNYSSVFVPKVSDSKLKDLAWSLDINETIYSKDSKKLQSRDSIQSNFQV